MYIAEVFVTALGFTSSVVVLVRLFLLRIGKQDVDLLAPSLAGAISVCTAIYLSRYDSAGHDRLLFIAGVTVAITGLGLFLSLRRAKR